MPAPIKKEKSVDMTSMNKKELKEHINQNGFFLNMVTERISMNDLDNEIDAMLTVDNVESNAIKMNIDKPEKADNIIFFKGLASQKYKKGEKNRNGYKIDPNGWDFSAYENNPQIFLQHNSEYGGIGKALAFNVNGQGLNIIFYVDTNTLDERTKYQVENWYISAISTGHITLELMIEDNKTWKRMTVEEASEEGVDLFEVFFWMSDAYTLVVSKAEMIENSLVSIGSNDKALATQNALEWYCQNAFNSLQKNMPTDKNEVTDTPEVSETPADTPETQETKEAGTEETTETQEETTEGADASEGDDSEKNGCSACEGASSVKPTDSSESDSENETDSSGETPEGDSDDADAAENAGEADEGDSTADEGAEENVEALQNKVAEQNKVIENYKKREKTVVNKLPVNKPEVEETEDSEASKAKEAKRNTFGEGDINNPFRKA